MRDLARSELDRIDKLMRGQGMLEAYMFGRGNFQSGSVGGAIDYGHRLSPSWSVFGHGEVAHYWGEQTGLGWSAMAGIRGRF